MKRLSSLFVLSLGLLASDCLAQAGSSQGNFVVDAQYGFTTSKSSLVGSNDTGSALRYGLGGYAGAERQLAFLLHFEQDLNNFALNTSKLDLKWQDTRLRYHLGFFYLGLLFTKLDMKAEKEGLTLIDAAGSGFGLNTGLRFSVGRRGGVYLDLMQARVADMKNSLDQTLSIPQRLDMDLGASIDLTAKLLDLTFGFRVRQLTIQTDESYRDSLYATYFGLRTHFYF